MCGSPRDRRLANLEPQVANAAAISGKIFERIESVEAVDWEVRDCLRKRKSNVHSNTPASALLKAQAAPAKYTTACRAKVNFKRRIRFANTRVN